MNLEHRLVMATQKHNPEETGEAKDYGHEAVHQWQGYLPRWQIVGPGVPLDQMDLGQNTKLTREDMKVTCNHLDLSQEIT